MCSIEAIQTYLAANPWVRAKDIAQHLGCTRKSVNSSLHYNPSLFRKISQTNGGLLTLLFL